MNSLAIIASRGSFTSMVQVTTLLMAAVGSGISVRVFFRDEAVGKVTRRGAVDVNLAEVYQHDTAGVTARLKSQGLLDLPALFREMKDVGDIRFYVCSSSLAIWGARPEDLIPEIDEVRGLAAFLLDDIAAADRVLTF